jgi:type IV secretion system protein VirB2
MKNFIIYLGVLLFLILGSNSYATTSSTAVVGTPTEDIATKVICNVVKTLTGPISQGVATLVIIITGYSFFVGKVSIGMLFVVTGGIMFVFGAETIMGWVFGVDNYQCRGGQITPTR